MEVELVERILFNQFIFMLRFKLITFVIVFTSFQSQAQGFFWTQYEADNPAASGVNSRLSVSSVSSFRTGGVLSERISAQARIQKLHGGISTGYRYMGRFNGYYRQSNPYLNYSFHVKTGENILLAFGVGAEWTQLHYGYGETTDFEEKWVNYRTGVHFQYKGFQVGVTGSTYENGGKTRFGISDVYADYTTRIGQSWELNAGLHFGKYDSGIMAKATYRNKYWFGVNYGFYQGIGIMAGMNVNDKLSIGYSFSVGNLGYNQKLMLTHGLMLRFKLP